MMSHERERELERLYPMIDWREPLSVQLYDDEDTPVMVSPPHYACRFCVSMHGLKGCDVPNLPTDIEEMRRHIREKHL